MDEEKFIQCVRQYDNLFNPSNKDYRNPVKKIESWNAIGEEMGISGNECKDIWTKLRNSYTNAIKRRKTKTGQAAMNMVKWKFEDQMSFLDFTFQPRKPSCSLLSFSQDDDIFTENEENVNDSASFHSQNYASGYTNNITTKEQPTHDFLAPALSDTSVTYSYADKSVTMQSSSTPECSWTPLSKSEIKKEEDAEIKYQFAENFMKEVVQIMKDNSPTWFQLISTNLEEANKKNIIDSLDETEMFFLSLAKSVKKLSPIEQSKVKMEVSNIVFQAEINALQQISNQ